MSNHPSDGNNSDQLWDFLKDIDMTGITGPKSNQNDSVEAVTNPEAEVDPVYGYLPHSCTKFWEMLQLAEDHMQPEKVERAQRFFAKCPDGSCRKKFVEIFNRLGAFGWLDK